MWASFFLRIYIAIINVLFINLSNNLGEKPLVDIIKKRFHEIVERIKLKSQTTLVHLISKQIDYIEHRKEG